MGLSKLTQISNDTLGYIDRRGTLFYNKYQYRARYYCAGLDVVYWAESEADVVNRLKNQYRRFKNANVSGIINFFNWKKSIPKESKKTYTIRMEGGVAAVFSNDLNFLKTLENEFCTVDYTLVDQTVPDGIKYFTKEPKHKYRFHLKSKRVKDGFALKLSQWLEKYSGTGTVMVPSNALSIWLDSAKNYGNKNISYHWRLLYTSSHYYIDYDDESTLTLFMLMFDGMVHKKYKLLKRPE